MAKQEDKIEAFMKGLSKKLEEETKTKSDSPRRLIVKLAKTSEEFKRLAECDMFMRSFPDEIEQKFHDLYMIYLEGKKKHMKAWHIVKVEHGLVGKELSLDVNTGEVWEVGDER